MYESLVMRYIYLMNNTRPTCQYCGCETEFRATTMPGVTGNPVPVRTFVHVETGEIDCDKMKES